MEEQRTSKFDVFLCFCCCFFVFLSGFFTVKAREIREIELFYITICSAVIHCRWSKGWELQSYNILTESCVLCNSTSSVNISDVTSYQKACGLKNGKWKIHSNALYIEHISILSLYLLSKKSAWLYFRSSDSWVCLSMCVRGRDGSAGGCVVVCVWITEAGNLWKCCNQGDDEEHADGTSRLIKTH